MRVKPKIVQAARLLADAENEFRDFQKNHEVFGRKVFTKTLDYYLNALKFDSGKAMDGLDEEIQVNKRMIDQINLLRLARIKSA